MVKKFSKASRRSGHGRQQSARYREESSSQIWLAGLGAFAKAQEEGSKVFEALVKEGAGLQKKFRQFADAQVSDVTNEVSGKITEATSKAAGAWIAWKPCLKSALAAPWARLGVPTKADIQKLTERVEELTKQVQKAQRRQGCTGSCCCGQEARCPQAGREEGSLRRARCGHKQLTNESSLERHRPLVCALHQSRGRKKRDGHFGGRFHCRL